ncbi:zinc finger protein 624-like [Anopheles bellator]|uniref:zinc finger protein 624-like n=1 Tax=Anopheles bellator TaxID=139047 RepID=UPI002647596E|nr:zinc finger protein 624-like [Anopheles bellator]
MDTTSLRHVINDPNQCRLCMRVCDDSFLEYIFSDKEYSIAHQIFECTSIRVTKQDNLTKICKNCASLLFLTTEFRNACFKTNRLLMEDFVIMELGDWASDSNQLLLRECENIIIKHKHQVDYVYAGIVTDSEQYLGGPLEIGQEYFGAEHAQMLQPAQRPDGSETVRGIPEEVGVVNGASVPEEPDPEILMEISKFLEEQIPNDGPQGSDGHELWTNYPRTSEERCTLCYGMSEAGSEPTQTQLEMLREQKLFGVIVDGKIACESCCLLLDIMDSFRKTIATAQRVAKEAIFRLPPVERLPEHAKALLQTIRLKQEAYRRELHVAVAISQPKGRSQGIRNRSYKRPKTTCHICGKQYDNWKFQTHLNEHENVRPYVCDENGCGSAFTGMVFLNRHKKLWHTDYYYAVCGVCGKQCKTQGIYQTHISYHEEPKLPCSVCGKLMRNKRAIWKHMKTHNNDRKHVCTVCHKKFTIAYTLRVHMRIHTNEKPYPCAKCDKRFQYKCLLKNHTQKHHEEAGD